MKPTVHQYEDKLLEFAYGELPAPEASAVQAHVTGCARCTQALNEIRTVRVTMGQLPRVEAPDAGLESLFAYAEQAARRNAAGPSMAPAWWKRMVAPLAGVCALGLVAVVGWKTSSSPEMSMAPSPEQVAVKAAESARDVRAAPTELAEAPPPAPVVAAPAAGAPEPAPAKERAKAPSKKGGSDLDDNAFGDEGGKNVQQAYGDTRAPSVGNMLGETPTPSKQQELRDNIEKAGKLSKSRRAEVYKAEEEKTVDAKKDATREDYSNARGGYIGTKTADKPEAKPAPRAEPQAAPPPEPAAQPAPQEAQAAKPGFGLGTTSSNAGPGRAADSSGARQQKESVDDLQGQAQQAAPSGASSESKRKAPLPAAPPKTKALDREAEGSRDEGRYDKSPAASPKDIAGALSNARTARSRSDYSQEISLASQALNAGAQGSQRAEALSHLCEAWDALGREAEAQKYCDALLTEFPKTEVAQRIAQRRNAATLKPPARAKAEKKSADQFESDEGKGAKPAVKKITSDSAAEAAY